MNKTEVLFIYTRVSTLGQATKDLSLPRQRQLGINKAKELGMSYKIYEDAGESASHDNLDNRPQLQEILDLVKQGIVKHLWIFDATRLSRNDYTKLFIHSSLKKQNVNLYTHSKSFDFNIAEDELMYKFLEAYESYETVTRKRRFKLGYVSANKKGRYLMAIPPYGYKKNDEGFLIVDEEEKAIFLKIVDLYLNEGYGTFKIAQYLNDNFIPTKTSKLFENGYTLRNGVRNRKSEKHVVRSEWNPGTVLTMLKSEVYYGKRKFKVNNEKFEYVDCEPLVDKQTWDKIQRVRFSNAINGTKEDKYFYLLKDILTCGNCGQPLHGRVKLNRGEFAYRCNSRRFVKSKCTSRGINITKLNNIAWNAFRSSVFYHRLIDEKILLKVDDGSGEKATRSLEDQLTSLKREQKEISAKMKKLIRQNLDNHIPQKLYAEIFSELEAQTKLVDDNILLCLSNLKRMNAINKKGEESGALKGLSIYYGAVVDVDGIYPGKTKDEEILTRNYIRGAISGITVTYKAEERKHIIEVHFHDVGSKDSCEQLKFANLKNRSFEVSQSEKVNCAVLALPKVSNEYFLNSDKKFRKRYERQKLNVTENIDLEQAKILPPLPTQLHR